MYIDESGSSGPARDENDPERFLGLTGVIIEKQYALEVIRPEMDELQRRYFQVDPDTPIALHRKDIVRGKKHFSALKDPDTRQAFNADLLEKIATWRFTVVTNVIDKWAHQQKGYPRTYPAYEYVLKWLMERYCEFLEDIDDCGDIMIESRSGTPNKEPIRSFEEAMIGGTLYFETDRLADSIDHAGPHGILLQPKSAMVAGLQLADLLAYPTRRCILIEKRRIAGQVRSFEAKIEEALASKYLRRRDGGIWGAGKKLWP